MYGQQGQYAQFGQVAAVDLLRQDSAPSSGVAGAVAGSVIGGAVGNQIGRGSGRAVATTLGVVGGALIGRAMEQQLGQGGYSQDVYYEIGRASCRERV